VSTASVPRRRPLPFLAVLLGAWAGVALLLAAQAWFAGAIRGEPLPWSRALAVWFAWAASWATITPVVFALAQRFPLQRARLGRALLVHALAAPLAAAAALALFAGFAPHVGSVSTGPDWLSTWRRLLGTSLLLQLPVYALVLGAVEAMRLAHAARVRERRALQLELQLSEARLLALRAQLEPHFLFNAMNTAMVLMREDVDAAEQVLLRLGRLLRRTLETTRAHEVALQEELAFVEAYLAVEQARFGDRMRYAIEVDAALHAARVPSLILQPLVENAVRHGLGARVAPGTIRVSARREGERLRLEVRDDGPGPPAAHAEGVGLANTRARLALLYGGAHEFALRAAPGGGALATLAFPLRGAAPA
jgi:two-component system LytT family sensor kinase